MPIATPGNNYLIGIGKQTNEATVLGTAAYSLPVYTANAGPAYDERRVEVTDASVIQADVYKGPSFWQAEVEFPAFQSSLGAFLQSVYAADATTPGTPNAHVFTGLGSTQPWMSVFTAWPGASHYEVLGKGQATSIGFSATGEGGPLRVRYAAYGQSVSAGTVAWTATTADDLTDGYFTLQHDSAKIEADFDTPNSNPSVEITNVTAISLNIDRSASPVQTADSTSIAYISSGLVAPSGSMTMVYSSWDAYNATFFGAVAGTSLSSTLVKGALELTFKHSTDTNATFVLYAPAVQFKAAVPQPNTNGDALTQEVTLNILKPSSGEHIQPTLSNDVAAGYD